MKHSIEPNKALRQLALLAISIVIVGVVPALAKIVGFQFLPSVQWYNKSMWLAWCVGAFSGAIFTLIIARERAREEPDGLSLKSFGVVLFSPFFFGIIGMDAVSVGFPMLYTSVFGMQGEHQYVVERAVGFSDRKCPNKIELRETPLMYDTLCGASEEFRNQLEPGMHLVVFGRSSQFGVFVVKASKP